MTVNMMCAGLLPAALAAVYRPDGLLCDFCGRPVSHYYTVSCPSFRVYAMWDVGESSCMDVPLWGNDGNYCACPTCWAMIELHHYDALILYVMLSLDPEVLGSGMGSVIYESMLRTCYSVVFKRDLRLAWMALLDVHFNCAVDVPIT